MQTEYVSSKFLEKSEPLFKTNLKLFFLQQVKFLHLKKILFRALKKYKAFFIANISYKFFATHEPNLKNSFFF